MLSFKSFTALAVLALAGFTSAAPLAPLADVNAHLDSSVKVGRGLPNVGGLLSPVTKKVGRDLLDVDAAADADVKVGHVVEANANADAEVEVFDRRHDGSLLSLVDTAIVDITVSAHALIYLQPANATVETVTTLLTDIKVTLATLLVDVKALVGLDVSVVLGVVTDVNVIGKVVADLLILVFTALGGVLNIVAVAKVEVVATLLADITCIVGELLKVVFGLVDGLLGVVGGLLAVVLGLIGAILPIILQLNVSVLISVLAL
ncbi:hypothetical protein K523DRAFT_287154 [Schizophyllum commune Tattone D]|nr:hypothetical protein K523DRAFT_287154 [Schizophyllum commune Tattone D]